MYLFDNLFPKKQINIRFKRNAKMSFRLVSGLRTESSVGIGHLDVQLLGSLNDLFSQLSRHGVSDLSREGPVLHEQHLKFLKKKRQKNLKKHHSNLNQFRNSSCIIVSIILTKIVSIKICKTI